MNTLREFSIIRYLIILDIMNESIIVTIIILIMLR